MTQSAYMTAADFQRRANVSRETLARLQVYADMLQRWQRSINLVSPRTIPDLWRRHFLDSAQLIDLVPTDSRVWLDLGSGAGFPGLVLAILGIPEMHLVESDGRKCAFLGEVARATETRVSIHHGRVESIPTFVAEVISARALAPLDSLLTLSTRFTGDKTVALFPKGQDVENELTEASKSWNIELERVVSRSDPRGTILRVKGFRRV